MSFHPIRAFTNLVPAPTHQPNKPASNSCYKKINDTVIHQPDYTPCPNISINSNGVPIRRCCYGQDTCLPLGFCLVNPIDEAQNEDVEETEGGSKFYFGGCTDASFQDQSCPKHCVSLHAQDVVYNKTDKAEFGLWRCCVNSDTGENDCESVSGNEAFVDPSPQRLLAAAGVKWNETLYGPGKGKHHGSSGLKLPLHTLIPVAVAGFLVLALSVGLFTWCCLRRRRAKYEAANQQEPVADQEVVPEDKLGGSSRATTPDRPLSTASSWRYSRPSSLESVPEGLELPEEEEYPEKPYLET